MPGISAAYITVRRNSQTPSTFWPSLAQQVPDQLDPLFLLEPLSADMHRNDQPGREEERSCHQHDAETHSSCSQNSPPYSAAKCPSSFCNRRKKSIPFLAASNGVDGVGSSGTSCAQL